MHRLTAVFHVSTPLFLGNAAQQPELLAAPFKHALRFWWRALNYDLVETDPQHPQPFKRLHDTEAALFGAVGDEKRKDIGRCPFNFRARFEENPPKTLEKGQVLTEAANDTGLIYLGYGLLSMGSRDGALDRGCLWTSGGFDLRLELTFPRERQVPREIVDAVKLVGLLGGLGGRSRRGFGSLSLMDLRTDGQENWAAPASVHSYREALREILSRYQDRFGPQLPEFTGFGSETQIEVVGQGVRATQLLGSVGQRLQRYRSWGINRDGQRVVGRHPSEKRFRSDHNWYLYWKAFAEPLPRQQRGPEEAYDPRDRPDGAHPPRRAVFGLPQNYKPYLGVTGPKADGTTLDRRSSPLFIHIHRIAAGSYAAVLSVFPARFLPEDRVDISFRDPLGYTFADGRYEEKKGPRQGWSERLPQAFSADFSVISGFFSASFTAGPDSGKPYFPAPARTRVWP